jgi:hypothetical protein
MKRIEVEKTLASLAKVISSQVQQIDQLIDQLTTKQDIIDEQIEELDWRRAAPANNATTTGSSTRSASTHTRSWPPTCGTRRSSPTGGPST